MKARHQYAAQSQAAYLRQTGEELLHYKAYSRRATKTDHDHCEFCFQKFADSGEDTIQEGYATLDNYRWICSTCFNDFKEQFRFKVYSDRV